MVLLLKTSSLPLSRVGPALYGHNDSFDLSYFTYFVEFIKSNARDGAGKVKKGP
jgi:hypothetical protein